MTLAVPTRVDHRNIRHYDVPLPVDLAAGLRATVDGGGGRTAYVTPARTVSWSDFGADVRSLARRLSGGGVVCGDRVAVLAANGLPFTTAIFAAWELGAIAVPLNFRLTAADLSALIADSRPRLLLVGPGMAALARDAVDGVDGAPALVLTDGSGRFLPGAPAGDLPPCTPGGDAPAAIMYTSGTTGRPKGVVISHGNALQNSVTCIAVIGRRPEDVELVMVPQFNITGLFSQTVPAMLSGMTAVLLDGFDARRALDAIAAHDVTSTVGAPTMWWRLLEQQKQDDRSALTGLRLALFGGAPMPATLIAGMRSAMPDASFGNGYGMTETCSMITYLGGEEVVAKPHAVGRPLPLTELRIVSPETGLDAGPGETGEIVVRGGQVAIGYWTCGGVAPLTDAHGWIATGDAAVLEDDLLVLRDRLKDVIKRGGESIFSFEVESCLHQHPSVADAAVVGVPDEQYGERVVAYVVAEPGRNVTPDEVRAYCREHLAHFKVPSIVEVRRELPRNPGGKVIKSALRSEHAV
ncbi:MAG: long-chain fatty acid--CoA ligase [Mycobacteriales bacterium]